MARPKVLCTLPMDPAGDALVAPVADIAVCPDSSADAVRKLVGDADVLVVRSQLPADLLDRPHRLLGIVRHGTGLDLIPVEAATKQAVIVANVPGVNAEAVAEYCIGSLLALARQLHAMDRDLHGRSWNEARKRSELTFELRGRTLGVVGVGDIGRRVAEIAHHGFGMRVLGHQRRREAMPAFVEYADLDTLFAASDAVSLNCPLTPETRHLLDEKRLRGMKPHALIVNAARGPVIDEEALAKVLAEGKIGGAALDVYGAQPLAKDFPKAHPFLGLPNVLLTPHVAGLTQEASRRMGEGAGQEVLRILAGERPRNYCNPETWDAWRQRRAGLAK
jgi:D-3-phosphoglycerate dehydrogenase